MLVVSRSTLKNVVLLVTFLCSHASLARAQSLESRVTQLLDAPRYQHALWGLLVVDLESGEEIYAHHPDKLFVPASTTKLYSVATALDALGAGYRFLTPVYRRGEVDGEGRLHGNLILVSSGDLSMGGRTDEEGHIAFTDSDHTYANGNSRATITAPNPLDGLDEIARQIAAAGIRRVEGDVLIDDRLFDSTESSGSGPERVTPVKINDNLIDVVVTPTQTGDPAKVEWRPHTAAYQIDGQVATVAEGREARVVVRRAGAGRLEVAGQIPVGHDPLLRVHEVPDPTNFARTLLIEALERAGVSVAAWALAQQPSATLPRSDEYSGLAQVAVLRSPPFAESARLVLKVSHNLHASTLPLLVAVQAGERRLADGLRLESEFLARAGVDPATISFGGGAGGSRSDYVTPRATVALLRYMAGRDDFEFYRDALPVLGVDGTLADVVDADSPARGRVRAKTGTLLWGNGLSGGYLMTSKALAGYIDSASGRKLAFAAFLNNVHLEQSSQTAEAGRTLGQLCEILFADE